MPKLEATYEPMIVKEARYIAITMMKVSLMQHSLAHLFTFRRLQMLHKGELLGPYEILYTCSLDLQM